MRETPVPPADAFDLRLGLRLQDLRRAADLTLDDLAGRTGISRATLSRVERGETSATTQILNRIGAAYGRPTSSLIAEAETPASSLIRAADQAVWTDPATGYRRRMVSPPGHDRRAEVLECHIPAGATVAYDTGVAGQEQHLVLQTGQLDLSEDGTTHQLAAGDCLRFRLTGGPVRFHAPGPAPAQYLLVLIRPQK